MPVACSRALQGGAASLQSALDPFGLDDVPHEPVGTRGPVVPVIFDARLQRDYVAPGRLGHGQVRGRHLEDLAYRVGVSRAVRIGDDDLVSLNQVGQIPEHVVTRGARISYPVTGYVGVGPRYPGVTRARHVASPLREARLGNALDHRDVGDAHGGNTQVH